MKKEDAIEFFKRLAPNDEAYGMALWCLDDERATEELIEYVKKEKLDLSHIWEDSEDGDHSGDDWDKFCEKAIEIENRYGLNYMDKYIRK